MGVMNGEELCLSPKEKVEELLRNTKTVKHNMNASGMKIGNLFPIKAPLWEMREKQNKELWKPITQLQTRPVIHKLNQWVYGKTVGFLSIRKKTLIIRVYGKTEFPVSQLQTKSVMETIREEIDHLVWKGRKITFLLWSDVSSKRTCPTPKDKEDTIDSNVSQSPSVGQLGTQNESQKCKNNNITLARNAQGIFTRNQKISTKSQYYKNFMHLLGTKESKRSEGANWEIIPVQGNELLITPRAICEFYNTPYYESNFLEESDLEYFRDINMDNFMNYLTKGRGEWKHRP
ncbi:hypothetical protein Golob_021575, partial [Gossypium lobatum]|nr:hypothetical protein [Gossypium lobatum]